MLITSLLDNDLYKVTMMQFVFHHFPNQQAEYQLFHRNTRDKLFNYGLVDALQREIAAIAELSFQEHEIAFLETLHLFSPDFLCYLKNFKLSQRHVAVQLNQNLDVIVQGRWVEVILWEVILLALISELYFKDTCLMDEASLIAKKNLDKKILMVKECKSNLQFIEYGTRRRFSKSWQEDLNKVLIQKLPNHFLGTSSMKLAMDLGISCYGTMGHEILQAGQRLSPTLPDFQNFILRLWLDEFQSNLAIALSDVLSLEAFLADFDLALTKSYTGIRIDSGDPIPLGEQVVQHYTSQGIDPLEKRLIFSDSMNFSVAIKIAEHFKDKIQVAFGIGTNLTNDHGIPPLNIVMKITSIDGKAVGKLTNCKNKSYCLNPSFLCDLKKLDAQKRKLHLGQVSQRKELTLQK